MENGLIKNFCATYKIKKPHLILLDIKMLKIYLVLYYKKVEEKVLDNNEKLSKISDARKPKVSPNMKILIA